jgi:rhamnulokinase
MSRFAAVDLGAQSGRVAVGRLDGGRLTVEEAHRFPNLPVRAGGTLYWDVLRLWADVLDGLRAAGRLGRVESIAVDSWAVDFGLVDRVGSLLRNPVHYRDARRTRAMDAVLERVPARELYERTGIQLLPINTIFELAGVAAANDPALTGAHRLLLIPDLFHHWLCGSLVSEHTNATTTQCLDVRTGGWLVDILERLDIPASVFPEIVQPATVLGAVTGEAAAEAGVGAAQVVAGATHDTAAAVAAIPLRGDRSAFISVGTWSLVGVETAEPVLGESAFRANLTNEGGVAGTIRVLRNVTGLWLLQECVRAWTLAGRPYAIDDLLDLARSAAPLRSLVDPNDQVFVEPGDMPARIRDYCERTAQPQPRDDGAVVRCILESLALKHAETIDVLAAVTDREIAEIHLVGGGANNELLCAWTAEAAGTAVLAGPAETTLIGNLLVQAMALGEIGSLTEARDVVRRSFAPVVYEPESAPAWREARERFTALSGSQQAIAVAGEGRA